VSIGFINRVTRRRRAEGGPKTPSPSPVLRLSLSVKASCCNKVEKDSLTFVGLKLTTEAALPRTSLILRFGRSLGSQKLANCQLGILRQTTVFESPVHMIAAHRIPQKSTLIALTFSKIHELQNWRTYKMAHLMSNWFLKADCASIQYSPGIRFVGRSIILPTKLLFLSVCIHIVSLDQVLEKFS
jgi:hypothetical protein